MKSERREQVVAAAVLLGGIVALIARCTGMLSLPILVLRYVLGDWHSAT